MDRKMPTTSEQKVLQRIINLSAEQRNNIFMKDSVVETAKQILDGIESEGTKLVVRDVFVKERFDNADIQSQQEIRNKGQTWGDELRANLDVVDSVTGKKIDSVNGIKIATIPKMTDRGTYLINGNEFEFTRQARLKPGVYTKVQNNGEISSFFNVDKTVDFERGFNNNFKISFNPERRAFFMQYGTKNIPLINAMRALGATKDEMQRMWGKDVYEANASAYDKHENRDQNKFYLAVFGKNPDPKATQEQIQQEIKQRLFDTELDPDVTQITLGKRYSKVDKGAILDASKKVIDIHRGDVEPDDREALIFKSFHDADDHVRERLIKNADKIRSNIRFKLGKTRQINKSMSTQTFDPFISGTLTTSVLANPPSQTNVMSIVGDTTKMTVMGEGGIGSANAVTNDTRQISNSEAGFIDPLHTPEGGNIGIAVHIGIKTVKMGNDLYSQFYNMSGEKQMLRPVDTYNQYVAFPDQYDVSGGNMKAKSGTIKAVYRGKLVDVPKSKIDLVISSPINMFDTSANMIPFLDSIQGNRGLTASKMQEQALPLKFREKPLFKIVDEKRRSLSESIASNFGLPKATDDGVVESVTDRAITIRMKDGETKKFPLYKDFSLNAESFISNIPRVSVGDRVVKGQVLADNNFTQDGQVAVGANLRVAYLPYKGYNYEDSAIISESAAKKLTSEHMYDLKARKSSKGVFSREKFRAYYPEEMSAKVAEKLDKDGVIKPGQRVERDDIIIAHLERRTPTADDIAVGRLDKQLKRDMTSHAVKWDHDSVGVVTSVQKHGNNVVVNVKSEEPLKVADKISGLHGNKHIISKIVPDDQMPYNPETGERIDLTMSPIGVSNRINTSQLLENAAGKIAAKTGKQYEVQNFRDVDNTKQLLEDLKAAGLSDKDVLIDPETNKPFINPVANGVSHIMKLEHRIDHKFSARYREGYDSNEQPASGGPEGAKNLGRMEFAALLARGADANLKEMFKIKGQRNDEYWRAMEMGQSLPPPKNAFVWDKMLAMMAGSGINVEQKGKTFTMKPMTDKDIDSISTGELSKPTETYRKKDLAPINGGLFDPSKAGGIHGDNYTHFKLPEKILNPITEAAVASMLDMPQTRLVNIIDGKQFVDRTTGKLVDPGTPNSFSGGPAVELLLSRIDVDGDLKSLKDLAQTTKNSTALNKYNKRIKYLRALKENGLQPTDYMMSKVLVVPSKYRPMFTMGTDGTVIMSDVNELYQQAAHTAESVSELKSSLKEVVKDKDAQDLHLAEVRGQMYQDVKAVAGLREPTAFLHRVKDKKGFISQIDGGKKQSKEGFFQDKVFERRQDLVGRSTIILNPELGGDEMGIPKSMAEKIFRPFIMKKMVSWGYSPLEAQRHIKEKTSIFNRALEVVSDERLVIANRAPTLHRWNMTAFKPKLTDGKSIEVPSVVINRNFGGDFDGDCTLSNVIIAINFNELQREIQKNQKIRFDSDFYIDLSSNIDYITSILKPMEVRMPSVEKLLVDHEVVVHMHISQFPRIEETKKVKDNGNEEYDVPDGVSIFTIDNVTHEFSKVPVKTFSIHKNLPNYTIETSSGDSMLLSHDQSAVAINRATWEIERVTPEDLQDGRMIPKIKNTNIAETIFEVPLIDYSTSEGPSHNPTNHCKKSVKLNNDFGWLIGAMVGDGWVSNSIGTHQLCLAAMDENIGAKFCRVVNTMLDRDATPTIIDRPHEFEGRKCFSRKYSITTTALTNNFVPWIGRGAYNKHLPPFYMSAPREFREGLLSGLLDTDGAVCWLQKKNGRQFNIQYSSMSEVLIDEIVSLCRSLGISASISLGNKRPGGIERRAVLSTNTVHGKKLSLVHRDKSKAFAEFCSSALKDSSISARQDLVPFSPEILMIAKEFVHHIENKALYNNINDSKRYRWRISRQSAKRLIALDLNHRLPQRWVDIVNNENVTWIYATSVRLNRHGVDMYDITAPGPYTFMLSNGIIVQDTFQIHTPISPKALKEAESMKPSSSMLKTGYDSVLNAPAMDMVVGSWLASTGRGGSDTGLKFDSVDDAIKALKAGTINYADRVTIDGRKATLAIHDINESVPDDMKRWDITLDNKGVSGWIKDVTKSHNGKLGLQLADKIKQVGNNYVTTFGFTLGLSDTIADKEVRNKVLKEAKKKVKPGDDMSVIKAYAEAKSAGEKMLVEKHGDKTMLGIGIKSGGGKGIGNTAAITLMPGIVMDAQDRPIPMPITRSYSEGLDTFGYWAAAHGARGGNIKKSISSSKPGWMTKDLINSIYETRIATEDPMDNEGIEYDIGDRKGIANRYLAQDVKDTGGKIIGKRGDLIDSDLINKMMARKISKVFVQSPISDPSPGDGFSSWSYGADYDGKRHNRGDHIGIISSHTITEPSVNLAMKSFHTGGAFEIAKRSTGTFFDALDRTLRFTQNLPDKGTLSSIDGVVKSIKPSSIGGYDVIINDGDVEEVRYVQPGNHVSVKEGQRVSKGAQLDDGIPSPHDMLKYRGMREAQKFLVKRIDALTDNKLDKRDIETIVRGITNTTKVMKPGSSNYVPGDVAPLSTIEWYNKNNRREEDVDNATGDHFAVDQFGYKQGIKITDAIKKDLRKKGVKRLDVFKDRIKHEPFLTPAGIGAKSATGEDWIARLAHNRIKQVLEEGTTQGWKSIASDTGHPIPQYITGEYTW